MVKFANKTANIDIKNSPVYTTVSGRPSHTSKTAEIILLGHRVIERWTGCPYKPMWRDPI